VAEPSTLSSEPYVSGSDEDGTIPEGTPDREAARLEVDALLSTVIDREAGDPANAWALAHGMLAKGADFVATDGRLARHVLIDDFLEATAVPRRPDKVPSFPQSRGAVRVEPHTDLILKTFVEVGLPMDAPLSDRPGAPTLAALVASSQLRFEPVRSEGASLLAEPNDAPWSAQAWCQANANGAPDAWTTGTAGDVTLEEVSAALLGTLERETWFIRQALAEGKPFEKKKQGIFGFTCGGAHLFQGVEACAAKGWPKTGDTGARVAVLVDLYLERVPLETRLVEQTIQQYPGLAPLLYNQDVKFLGHLLEGLGKAERDGLWTPTADERDLMVSVETRLLYHVLQLEKLGVYRDEAMDGLARNPETFQFYLDLVGDACHAWRGLRVQEELRAGR